MDLKHLNAFLVVSRTKNFTKAAELLNYAQSNVTNQIQQLEEELNVKLFERIGKTITLTSEGENLLPYAQKMLTLSSDIKNLYTSEKDMKKIVIGSSESLSIYKLPHILKKFKETHPEVDIFIKILDTPDFVPSLSNNEVDIGLAIEPLISDKNITCVYQHKEPIHLFACPDHPLANKKHLSVTDFIDQPLILTGVACCYRKLFERDLLKYNIQPKIILSTGSVPVIKMSTISGLGSCVLPLLVVKDAVDQGKLTSLDYSIDSPIYAQLIHHKDKWISPTLAAFIETVKEYY